MALGPRLDLRQSQSLVMTPQLQQAIKLLALSNLEIEGFIAEELEKNPLLETGAARPTPRSPAEPGPDVETAAELDAEAIARGRRRGGEGALDIDHRPARISTRTAPSIPMRGIDGGLGLERRGR